MKQMFVFIWPILNHFFQLEEIHQISLNLCGKFLLEKKKRKRKKRVIFWLYTVWVLNNYLKGQNLFNNDVSDKRSSFTWTVTHKLNLISFYVKEKY